MRNEMDFSLRNFVCVSSICFASFELILFNATRESDVELWNVEKKNVKSIKQSMAFALVSKQQTTCSHGNGPNFLSACLFTQISVVLILKTDFVIFIMLAWKLKVLRNDDTLSTESQITICEVKFWVILCVCSLGFLTSRIRIFNHSREVPHHWKRRLKTTLNVMQWRLSSKLMFVAFSCIRRCYWHGSRLTFVNSSRFVGFQSTWWVNPAFFMMSRERNINSNIKKSLIKETQHKIL